MFNMLEMEIHARLHQQELWDQVEKQKLVYTVAGHRNAFGYWLATLLLNVGRSLVNWGTRLQAEYDDLWHDNRQYTA